MIRMLYPLSAFSYITHSPDERNLFEGLSEFGLNCLRERAEQDTCYTVVRKQLTSTRNRWELLHTA